MYKVKVSNSGTSTFNVESKDYKFIIDTKGGGITPPDTLLASMGSCIGVYIKKYSEGSNLGLVNFDIIVEAEFSKEPPICFKEISVSIDLKEIKLEERRKKALLEFIKNCPVHNTLINKPDVNLEII